LKFSGNGEWQGNAVVLAVPSRVAARLLAPLDDSSAGKLAAIRYASSVVLNMVFRRTDIRRALDGFGFVVPAAEKRNILACTYSSVKFPNRAPEGMETLRVFIGGALRPDLAAVTEDDALHLAARDLWQYLGIRADPVWHSFSRWPESMPQYAVGHGELIESVTQSLSKLPGIFLAGNAYSGVGLPDCISSGEAAAEAIVRSVSI
jgi:oxygen-dependent protoporphyrinogen oxidase